MKFVALISGGKDSFFNIYHCISQGHELVALCNLHPQTSGVDELDSFMFQTVGHEVIDYYGECLEVPLYRQAITGKSSNQDLEYCVTDDDEIEDLYRLLSSTIQKHPEVEAVSCGAILSHYQRTRVENVCDRLNLTSLCYLWQRDQYELMSEMCQYNLDARLIKVAAIGLNSTHLGKSIQQMLPQLKKLNQLYDVHVCGEGGEFETIVLDAPFFKKRLNVVDSKVIELSNDDVCYMKLKVELQDKESTSFDLIPNPAYLRGEFDEIYDQIDDVLYDLKLTMNSDALVQIPQSQIFDTPSKIYVSNITSRADTLEAQTREVFHQLLEISRKNGVTFNNIQSVTLLLDDMANFQHVNSIYAKEFSNFYLPPSRVCISTNIPTKIQLSCIILKPSAQSSSTKSGIHIKSRSYWAPHNIGPYSQSLLDVNKDYKLATISGQIPLVPSTMDFIEKGIKFDIIYALQHFCKIKALINVNRVELMTCFVTNECITPIVVEVWNQYSDSNNLLVVVQVKALPRNAHVEWGGSTYEPVVDMYEDSDDEGSDPFLEQLDTIKLFEYCDSINVNNSLLSSTLFTDDVNKVNQLLKENAEYVQIITSNDEELNGGYEFLPVHKVFNCQGQEFKYAIRWKTEMKK
jgi:diphthine-ammonia ligase